MNAKTLRRIFCRRILWRSGFASCASISSCCAGGRSACGIGSTPLLHKQALSFVARKRGLLLHRTPPFDRERVMSIGYTWEKLYRAVLALACSGGTLQHRLAMAYREIHMLTSDDF